MANGYNEWKVDMTSGKDIPHYYGDYVRTLFIVMAVVSFIATPLWGDLLPFGVIAQTVAPLLLVLLAGLTSAKNHYIMLINATISGVSVLLLESYAIIMHHTQSSELFFAREAGVLLMLGSLYFSIKTFRAMMSGKMGHFDSLFEFDGATPPPVADDSIHADISSYNE
ncbi:MAG: hypothetical protein AAB472_01045 [Patescibacteria group bacterium]